MIEIVENEFSENETETIKNTSDFDWIVFTSKNGVSYFLKALEKYNITPDFSNTKFAVIGKATAKILQIKGYNVSYVNTGSTSKRFASDLRNIIKKGQSVLFPLGNLASNLLCDAVSIFAEVSRIDVYKTTAPQKINENIKNIIIENKYDLIIFTSPSGFNNFLEKIQEITPENLKIACIGETTKKAIEEKEISPKITAIKANADGLTISISEYFKTINSSV